MNLDSLGSMGGLFSTPVLYGLGCGVAVGGGLALLVLAIRGLPARPDHEKQKANERAAELLRFAGRRGSLAAIIGLVVLLLTSWAVAGIAAGVL
ncbi:type II secretion system protein, partial [Streptomyces sp. NPDC127079]